jgi:hypothetical protein
VREARVRQVAGSAVHQALRLAYSEVELSDGLN